MLYYNRIDFSKYIDIDKTSASKECIIYHYFFKTNGLSLNNLSVMVIMM